MKTILITGANRGLGLELSRQYAQRGWKVIASCRTPEQARDLKKLLNDYPKMLQLESLDVADHSSIERLAVTLRGTSIDILFNNAGVAGQLGSFGNTDYDWWQKVFQINTMSTLKLAEQFIDHLEAGNQKLIAAMNSLMGSIAKNSGGGSYIYRSSKAALNMVVKSLSIDLQNRGISVVALHPGWVRTDMGGEEATLSIPESINGLLQVLERSPAQLSGKFFNYDGQELDW